MVTITQALRTALEGGTQGGTDTVELLELLINLVSCDSNSVRLHKLVVVTSPEIFQVLVAYVHRHYTDSQPAVVLSVQALSKLIAMTSFDHSLPEEKDMYAMVSRSVGEFLTAAQLLPILQEVLTAPTTTTAVRLVVVECMFIFIMRNDTLKRHAVHENGYIQMLLSNVKGSASKDTQQDTVMIRNYICACLRELCNTGEFIPVLIQNNAVGVVLEILKEDKSSSDVIALSAEIMEAMLKEQPDVLLLFPQKVALIEVTKGLLDSRTNQTAVRLDGSAEIVEAVCKMAETLFLCSAQNQDEKFFTMCIERHLERSLAHSLKAPSSRVATVAARALRVFIQYCPHPHNAGHKLLMHLPTLSHLLKLCVETTEEDKPVLFELCVLMSVALTQNSNTRRHVHQEVAQSFPMYTQSIHTKILRTLSQQHELSSFASLVLVDCTGVLLNNVQAVEWGSDSASGPTLHVDALRMIYAHQQKRMTWQTNTQNRYYFHMPSTDIPKAATLTLQLLVHAVNMTFGAETRRSPSPKALRSNTQTYQPPRGSPGQPLQYDTAPSPYQQQRPPLTSTVPSNILPDVETYKKFDEALALTVKFAKYYSANIKKKEAVYVPTGDGFVIRKTSHKNPWSKITPLEQVRSWTVRDLVEGDLFYFTIPFNELTTVAVERALTEASQHHTNAKKLFITTPQAAKGRRWFLYDMINSILPNLLSLLQDLLRALQLHGEDNVRFPLFMYREKEMSEGERSLHSGNLAEIVQQINFYFKQPQLK